jgi:hypothetical protein
MAAVLLAFVFSPAADARLDKIIGGPGDRGNPGDAKTASGLKEHSRSEPITQLTSPGNRMASLGTMP